MPQKRQALACASRQAPKEPSQKPPRPPRSDREATARRVDFVLGRRPEGVTEGADEGDAGGRLGGAGVLPRDPFAKGRPAEGGLVCARCGKNDTSSPGECRFHPALVRGPAPFMYGVEWQACKAAGHTHRDAGCYARSEHFYPVGLLSVASRGLPDSGEDCNDVDDDGPRPASAAPRPWGRSQ